MDIKHPLKGRPAPDRASVPVLGNVFLRSHGLQAAWNFERMQNLGFLFALTPSLDRIWNDPEARRRASLRHLEYFNTQPYMSGFCLGAVARLEEAIASAPQEERSALEIRLRAFKAAMSSTCAAIGDSFFWATLRPACAVLAVLVWALAAFSFWGGASMHDEEIAVLPPWIYLAGSAVYLIVFNTVATRMRWVGITRGYRMGEEVARELKKLPLRKWDARLRLTAFTLCGLAMVGLLGFALAQHKHWVLFAALVFAALKIRGFSNAAIYLSTFVLASAAAWILP